jgi:drug/metabolite transporter (DMT)-like permease
MRSEVQFHGRETPRAILTICAGVGFLVLNDAVAKLLTDRHDPAQIIFVRNLLALPMVGAMVLLMRGRAALGTAYLGVHALRGLLMVTGAYLYFRSLEFLPLAEATALVFSAPLFITALSVPLLGEAVGWRRWAAVVLGFVGVLIIVQPGSAAFQPASLLAVATAIFYALFMIGARWIGRDEGVWTMMFFVMLFPMLYAAPLAFLRWTPIDATDLPFFLAIAVCGSLGITLIGQAFRMAPAAIVAPFDYTALIWATALGWLIWRDVPGVHTLVGAAVIVASGVVIVLREARPRHG